jgi:ABC-2 type transport system permease protein
MSKILLILQREYLTRVKKKSFIIMTFLGPILLASLMVVPVWLASLSDIAERNVAVLDETGWFTGKFESGDNLKFEMISGDFEYLKEEVLNGKYDALLYIPMPELNIPTNAEFFSKRQVTMNMRSYARNVMRTEVENRKLMASGIDPEVIKSSKTTINIIAIRLSEDGAETKTYSEVEFGLGIFSGILIYFFIFLFGAQVMRGVIEEKTSRIIEVIVSSVKPFQLMMGKITGVALVGLTQFLLWVILTAVIYVGFAALFGPEKIASSAEVLAPGGNLMQEQIEMEAVASQANVAEIFDIIRSINFKVMIFSFLFYFLAGYLLYASLFAAIGSAVDSEADTQQFMLPVSAPLILGIIASNFIVNNPDGAVAFWLSVIPLTSPIVMMVRIPFGVPYWELILSMAVLVAGFIFTTWMAAKIYRTGILMYGKKSSYTELWKWMRHH